MFQKVNPFFYTCSLNQGKCRQGTAQHLNVLPPLSLLSLLRCAHARFRAGDSRF
jgi:hypothetical protein